MRDERFNLRVPANASTDLGAGPGIGLAQTSRDLDRKVVEVSGTFSGPVAIQAQVANAWTTVGSVDGASAPALVPIDFAAFAVRVDVTSVASGTPVCVLAGANTRADG